MTRLEAFRAASDAANYLMSLHLESQGTQFEYDLSLRLLDVAKHVAGPERVPIENGQTATVQATIPADSTPPKLARSETFDLWDAVTEYTRSCGGDTGSPTVGVRRMNAVSRVERVVETIAAKRHSTAQVNRIRDDIANGQTATVQAVIDHTTPPRLKWRFVGHGQWESFCRKYRVHTEGACYVAAMFEHPADLTPVCESEKYGIEMHAFKWCDDIAADRLIVTTGSDGKKCAVSPNEIPF